jgi:hypothetical protein
MAQVARPFRDQSRIERLLRRLQRLGTRRGVYGGSRVWLWIFVFAWGSRMLRRAVGSEALLVFREEVRPGESLRISHLTETYQGRKVRSRRRKIRS